MVHRAPSLNKFLFGLIPLFAACAVPEAEAPAPRFNAARLQLQIQNGLVLRDGKPFTGTVYTLLEAKKDTVEIVGFRKGREHGEWKKFYNNGKLQAVRFFSDGIKTGDYLAWWSNGNRQLAYHFEGGEYEGICREWSEGGVLIKEMDYKKGYEAGPQKQFYNNGKLRSNYVMIDGKRYGLLGTKNCVNVTDSIFKK